MSLKYSGLITLILMVTIGTSVITYSEVSNYEGLDESVNATDGYYFDQNLNFNNGASLLWGYTIESTAAVACFEEVAKACGFFVEINLTVSLKGAALTNVLDDLSTYATVSLYNASGYNGLAYEKGDLSTSDHNGRELNDELRKSYFSSLVVPTFYQAEGVLFNLFPEVRAYDLSLFDSLSTSEFETSFNYLEHYGFLNSWISNVAGGEYVVKLIEATSGEEAINFDDIPSGSANATTAAYNDFSTSESYDWEVSNSNSGFCFTANLASCEYDVKIDFVVDLSSVQVGDLTVSNLDQTAEVTIYDSNGTVATTSVDGGDLADFKFKMFNMLVLPNTYSFNGTSLSLLYAGASFQFPTFLAGYADSLFNLAVTESHSVENDLFNFDFSVESLVTLTLSVDATTGLLHSFEAAGYEVALKSTATGTATGTATTTTGSTTNSTASTSNGNSFGILLLVLSLSVLSSIFVIVRNRKFN